MHDDLSLFTKVLGDNEVLGSLVTLDQLILLMQDRVQRALGAACIMTSKYCIGRYSCFGVFIVLNCTLHFVITHKRDLVSEHWSPQMITPSEFFM